MNKVVIAKINGNNLSRYLERTNWIEEKFPNEKLKVFRKQFKEYQNKYTIVFPSSEEFEDFYDKLFGVIKTLQVLEQRNEIEIIEDIIKTK